MKKLLLVCLTLIPTLASARGKHLAFKDFEFMCELDGGVAAQSNKGKVSYHCIYDDGDEISCNQSGDCAAGGTAPRLTRLERYLKHQGFAVARDS